MKQKEKILLDKYFNEAFTYNIEQLSRYNDYNGREYWSSAFDSLGSSLGDLKLKHKNAFNYHFSCLEFALEKINEVKDQTESSKELFLYIDYFVLKTNELLNEIDNI